MPAPATPGKLGIIAGGGPIPLLLAEACAAQRRDVFIIGILGAASRDISRFPHQWAGAGAVGAVLRALKREACTQIVLVGPVRRPRLRNLRLDWGGLRILPGYLCAARGGDDRLLRYMVEQFEHQGFGVIGADQVLAELAAPAGQLGAHAPSAEHHGDISRAIEAARAVGARDIGQGAVVRAGVVLVMETIEGTDAMLRHCAQLFPDERGGRRGVLAKMPKPGQERRVDLPAIGVSTVQLAAAAGLAGIVFEARGALIVDLARVVQAADELGLFLLGVAPMEAGE